MCSTSQTDHRGGVRLVFIETRGNVISKRADRGQLCGQMGDKTMKRLNLRLFTILAVALLAVSAVVAQDKKMDMKTMPMDGMDMAKMHADGHHALMMAYHHNAVAFTRTLWGMAADGKIEDINLARAAFAEIKRSLEKMDEIHKMHMASMPKMDTAMMEKMKPMMEKMESEKAALMGHIQALENALQTGSPSAQEIEMHSATLLLKLEKMDMPEKKMAM